MDRLILSLRRSPRGTVLPHHLFSLLAFLPALIPSSCCKAPAATAKDEPGPVVQAADSVSSIITFLGIGADLPTDVFIYSDSDLCLLESHVTLGAGECVADVCLAPGGKLLLAVSGVRGSFNEAAMRTYQSAEQLTLAYSEDLVSRDISSASAAFEAGECPEVRMSPLFAGIALESVSNGLEGYVLLKNPEIYLSCAAATVEVFRQNGFYPSGSVGRTVGVNLPHSVGMFEQRPGIVLRCFPDESRLASLVFECDVGPEHRSYSAKLPPLGRGGRIEVDISVSPEGEATFRIR